MDIRCGKCGALMDMLGDDMDGVAAMLEDFDYAGLLGD